MQDNQNNPIFKNEFYIRILPVKSKCWKFLKKNEEDNSVYIPFMPDYNKSLRNELTRPMRFWKFKSDKIFHNSMQDEVYDACMKNVKDIALNGNNVLVLCNGQTNSGKSFTLSGVRQPYNERGIGPRILSELFTRKDELYESLTARVAFQISFVEFYTDTIRDLLQEHQERHKNDKNIFGGVTVSKVHNVFEAWRLLFMGEARRKFDHSAPYDGANLGNSVFTIYVNYESLVYTNPVVKKSTIHLIDFAGNDVMDHSCCFWKSNKDVVDANVMKYQLSIYMNAIAKTGKSAIRKKDVPKTNDKNKDEGEKNYSNDEKANNSKIKNKNKLSKVNDVIENKKNKTDSDAKKELELKPSKGRNKAKVEDISRDDNKNKIKTELSPSKDNENKKVESDAKNNKSSRSKKEENYQADHAEAKEGKNISEIGPNNKYNHRPAELTVRRKNLLISYLGDVLCTGTVLKVISHMRPAKEDCDVSLSSLKFGSMLRGFKSGILCSYTEKIPELYTQSLQEEINNLKRDLMFHKILLDQESPEGFSPGRMDQMKRLAEDYLKNKVNEITLVGANHVITTLRLFRDLYQELEASKEAAVAEAYKKGLTECEPSLDSMTQTHRKRRKSSSRESISKTESAGENASKEKQDSSKTSVGKLDPKAGIAVGRSASPRSINQSKDSAKNKSPKQSITSANAKLKTAVAESSAEGSQTPSKTQQPEPVPEERVSKTEEVTEAANVDEIPDYESAWDEFVKLDNWKCRKIKLLQERCVELTQEARQKHKEYNEAAEQLDCARIRLELAKCDLLSAQHDRHLSGNETYDTDGKIIPSSQELEIFEAVKKIEEELQKHKESLQTLHEEHKKCTENLNSYKQSLDEWFQDYCHEKFKTNIARIESDLIISEEEEECYPSEPQESKEELMYKRLQREMRKELAKQKLYRKL